MVFLVNSAVFAIQHGSHALEPSIADRLRVSFPASDSFVILAAALALVAALAIAQQASTIPSPDDAQGVAQALTWQSSTSGIALMSGLFAMQVGLLQWFTGELATRWVSNLFALMLAGLTVATAATLREWSDQSLIRAMKRSELDERIEAIEHTENQLPKLRYQGSNFFRRYLLIPIQGGLVIGWALVVSLGIVGESIFLFADWRFYFLLVVIAIACTGTVGIGGVIAAFLRTTWIRRDWMNFGFALLVATWWLTFTVGITGAVAIDAERSRHPAGWIVAVAAGCLTLIPVVMYVMAARTSRWPATLVVVLVGDALRWSKRDLLLERRRLDEVEQPSADAVGRTI